MYPPPSCKKLNSFSIYVKCSCAYVREAIDLNYAIYYCNIVDFSVIKLTYKNYLKSVVLI